MGLAVAGLIAAAPTSLAQSPPPIPSLPDIPGQEKARFKVVVEGEARSYAIAAGNGSPTGCRVTVKGLTVDEQVTYGRGKGVTMEFVRFKAGGRSFTTLQRSGRAGDASFAVRGTIARAVDRRALVTRAPDDPRLEAACPTATEQPASKPGCNTTFPLSADLKFLYNAGRLRLQPTSKELLGTTTPVEACPSSAIAGSLSGLVDHAWPSPPVLPSEPLSARTVFGNKRSFKVTFSKLFPAKVEPWPVINGTVSRRSAHDAVVRFTRLR